jgi:hypothetical protein
MDAENAKKTESEHFVGRGQKVIPRLSADSFAVS